MRIAYTTYVEVDFLREDSRVSLIDIRVFLLYVDWFLTQSKTIKILYFCFKKNINSQPLCLCLYFNVYTFSNYFTILIYKLWLFKTPNGL